MNVLLVIQIIVSILLSATILLQSRGTGLGTAWGGSGEFYRTKRGAERVLFSSTIILAVIFVLLSILNILT